MLGIVIPTMNRSDFLIRQLTYYSGVGYSQSIYVADSSEEHHFNLVQEAIRRLDNRIRIVHIQAPGSNDYQAIAEVLPEMREPYVAWIADDDFLIPRSLEQCVRFLGSHPDYESAHGVGVVLALKPDGQRGESVSSGIYPQRAVEHSSARLRLTDLFRAYWPVCFSVQRTETYREAVDLACRIPDKGFRELAMSGFPIIRGKAKQLDCLHLARQDHQGRYFLPDQYDWVTNLEWQHSHQLFSDHLSSELARQDGISEDEAREVVKEAFWSYISTALNQKWQGRYGQGDDRGVKRAARAVPGVRRTWHKLRSFLPGENNKMSLPALMRPSSPFHADFMPIYRAVTMASESPDGASAASQVEKETGVR